jgi:MerR family redox-sensitive transcriptional activator SoxR
MSMRDLNIGEVARRAGLHASAIRYYESIGLVPPPPRSSGWRRYPPDVLERLNVIRTARELGFSLEEIRTLLDGFPQGTQPSQRWHTLAESKLPEVEATIQRALKLKALLEAGLDCGCADVEVCITSEGESCLVPAAPNGGDDCDCEGG